MKWYFIVLKKYAVFSGRARRKEYWMYTLFSTIISIILGIIVGIAHYPSSITNVYTFAVLLPSIAVGVRRMHDVGKSGWYILIPIYNLVLACTNGNVGVNEYGPDPKNDNIAINDESLDSHLTK